MFPGELKCHRCDECDGFGCPDMLPGLGGVMDGHNFQANYQAWKDLADKASDAVNEIPLKPQLIRCGPVTGAVENIGFENEKDFYVPYLENAFNAGFGLCIGDGCPDEKLKYGIEAVKKITEENGKTPVDAAFFLKPYPQEKLFERLEWIKPYARYAGVDIDSYNILTMRNLVNLERKTAVQLEELRQFAKVPFVVKGVFTEQDIELVKQLRPDVVYISNHGGRVETRQGSTGDFLAEHAAELKKYCNEIWVDGGLRTKKDLQAALFYGADQVIMARPLIRATFDDSYNELLKAYF
ncbi:MAG: alpha-hydroxy-acid oxidizing protein [Treponema sp.]|nr:alpha-hydroxy-acid oxidizing protein [Treponema sp.]